MNTGPGKSLAAKLGFAFGDSVFVETTPDWYTDFADDNELELEPGLPATHAHIFCSHEAELADFLEYNDLADIEKSIWISWPKKTSGKQTDLDDTVIRAAQGTATRGIPDGAGRRRALAGIPQVHRVLPVSERLPRGPRP